MTGESAKKYSRWALAALFVGIGVTHFVATASFVAIVPDFLPWHRELVLVSGVFEILGGVGLLVPSKRRLAGWGLIALLVAVFPTNINMAVTGAAPPGTEVPAWAAWARLPLQFVLIYWVWWAACGREAEKPRG